MTIIEGDTVLFRKPGTADLHIDYSVGDISHSHTIRCEVTEDERTVGCDPMTIGDPDRILRLENGMTFMSSVSDRGSGRDRKLFIFNSDVDDPFASQNVQDIDLEYGAHGLCQVDGRVFFYSSSTIYALSEDFQTYKEVYDVDDYEICNLFAIDDTLYAEIRKVTEGSLAEAFGRWRHGGRNPYFLSPSKRRAFQPFLITMVRCILSVRPWKSRYWERRSMITTAMRKRICDGFG